jgi:hypothetical protein
MPNGQYRVSLSYTSGLRARRSHEDAAGRRQLGSRRAGGRSQSSLKRADDGIGYVVEGERLQAHTGSVFGSRGGVTCS